MTFFFKLAAGADLDDGDYKPAYSSVHGVMQILSIDDEQINQVCVVIVTVVVHVC